MAAPSKSWVVISDSQIDADSPLDTTLMAGIRDDLVHLEEWLGKDYTAAQNHDHDGTNSKSVSGVAEGSIAEADLEPVTAGEDLYHTNATARTTLETSYVKVKESTVKRGGEYRIQFVLSGNGAGRIYRNGSPVGTERTGSGTYSEDISGWSKDDLLQIYGKFSGLDSLTISNLELYIERIPITPGY